MGFRNSLIGAVSALSFIAVGSAANATACIDLASPNPGGIPAEGCTLGGTESNFVNLTDRASNTEILWTGTSHTVGTSINDDEIHVEAALDHIFDEFVDVENLVKLDSVLSGSGLTITPTTGDPSFGNFTAFDWVYGGSEALALLTMKIGASVLIFDVEGLSSGSAANTLILNSNGTPQGISHVSIWSGTLPNDPPGGPGNNEVDEPGVIAMTIAGLFGVAWIQRRKARG